MQAEKEKPTEAASAFLYKGENNGDFKTPRTTTGKPLQ